MTSWCGEVDDHETRGQGRGTGGVEDKERQKSKRQHWMEQEREGGLIPGAGKK